jgi:predicted metal-dependent peptidase
MDDTQDPRVAVKLAAARTRLILDKPFLGALVLRLPMIAADPKWCPTTATDARAFYYNADYINALKLEQVQFVLAHEALHCALSHFARRGHRLKWRWDIACDHAVNPLLIKEGLLPPPGVWYDDGFLGMTAEEIYPLIGDNNTDQPMDKHAYDPDNQHGKPSPPSEPSPEQENNKGQGEQQNAPSPLNHEEREQLAVQWRQRLAGAAQQALQAGKLGGDMARLVDHLLQPQLPWRMLLAHYLSLTARDDYTYMRPSRRAGDAIFPSLRSAQVNICVAIDSSGSISAAEMAAFFSEINVLKGQLRARISLLICDAALSPPLIFEVWEDARLPPEIRGGGGTSFEPVFTWIAAQDRPPDALVYFSDGNAQFPACAPDYPVLWLIKGRSPVPWGQRIQLN